MRGVSDRKYFNRILKEREMRYQERFASGEALLYQTIASLERSMERELASQEKAALRSVSQSETAISKAETAQAGVNIRGNEFRQSLDDYVKTMLTKSEAELKWNQIAKTLDEITDQIAELRRNQVASDTRRSEAMSTKTDTRWSVDKLLAIITALIGFGVAWFLKRGP